MKKFFKVVVAMMFCFFTATILAGCEGKIDEIFIEELETTQTIFYVGDSINYESYVVFVKYTNGTTKEIDHDYLKFSKVDTSTAGEKELIVTYKDHTCSIHIQVKEILVEDIVIDTTNMKTTYKQEQELNLEGLTCKARLNNGKYVDVELEDLTVSNFDMNTVGTRNLVISYEGKTKNISITIEQKQITKIEPVIENVKTAYIEDQKLNLENLKVKVYYNNDKNETVNYSSLEDAKCELVTENTDKQTVQMEMEQVKITYSGKTCTYTITVAQKQLESISVKTQLSKTEYFVGQTIDYSGLELWANYNNGKSYPLSLADVQKTEPDMSSAGDKKITLTYGEESLELTIHISTAQLTSISYENAPTSVKEGKQIDLTNLVVKAHYEDNTEKIITTYSTNLDQIDTNVIEDKTVVLTYNGKTAQFVVEVIAKELSSIVAVVDNVKKDYVEGQTLDLTNLKVELCYDNDTSETVDYSNLGNAECELVTENTDKQTVQMGMEQVKITYSGKTCTYSITVVEKVLTNYVINSTSVKKEYFVGETFSVDGLSVKAQYNDGDIKDISLSSLDFTSVDMNTPVEEKIVYIYLNGNLEDPIGSFTIKIVSVIIVELQANGLKTTYNVGDTLNLKNVSFKAIKNNGEQITDIALTDVIYANFTTEVAGENLTFVLRYDNFEQQISYSVTDVAIQEYELFDCHAPQNMVDYNANRAEKPDNLDSEFYDKNVIYKVGAYNEFTLKPNAYYFDDALDDAKEFDNYRYTAKVYMMNNQNNYEQLEENMAYYVSFEAYNANFNFTQLAVGKTFKIEIAPYGSNDPDYAFTYEVQVVDGFNVYNAKQLSVIDNHTDNVNKWRDIKAEQGLTNVNVSSVILHNNLVLSTETIGKGFFYQAEDADTQTLLAGNPNIVGSLRDNSNLFRRNLATNEKFSIYGNYFTIDAQNIPKIVYFPGTDAVTGSSSHSEIFRIKGAGSANGSRFYMEGVNYIGNTPRSEDSSNQGGLIFVKTEYITAQMTNCVTKSTFIAWFPTYDSVATISKVKSTDNYSNLAYSWRKGNITIENSTFKGSGGPFMVTNQNKSSEFPNDYPTINIDENTVIESYVTGTEAWFNEMNVTSYVSQLQALDSLIKGYSAMTGTTKSIYKDVTVGSSTVKQFNAIYALYDSNSMAATTTKCNVQIGEHSLKLDGSDLELSLYRANLAKTVTMQSNGKTVFVNKDGSGNYTLMKLSQQGQPMQLDTNDILTFMSGKYVNILLNSTIAIVVELFNV